MSTLLIQLPGGSSHFHRISGPSTVLGRSRESDIQVAARGVSRRHCKITRRGKRVIVEDLGSKNGVYVNDERVNRATLSDNDCIVLGEARIFFFAGQDESDEGQGARPGEATLDRLRWVETRSEVLFEGPKDYEREAAARPSAQRPQAPPMSQASMEKLQREQRLLKFRLRVWRSLSFARSESQLFEAAAEVLLDELPIRQVLVLENTRRGAVEGVFFRSDEGDEIEEILLDREAVSRVHRQMQPIAVRMDDSTAGKAKGSVGRPALLAPLMMQGRWFGALQVYGTFSSELERVENLGLLAAVAEILSEGLSALGREGRAADTGQDRHGYVPTSRLVPVLPEDKTRVTRYDSDLGSVVILRLGLEEAGWPEEELPERLATVDEGLRVAAEALERLGLRLDATVGTALTAFQTDDGVAGVSLSPAVEAAISSMLAVMEWNRSRQAAGKPMLTASAGIAHGRLAFVEAPEAQRSDITLFGPPLEELIAALPFMRHNQIVLAPTAGDLAQSGSSAGQIDDWRPPLAGGASAPFEGYRELYWKGRARSTSMDAHTKEPSGSEA